MPGLVERRSPQLPPKVYLSKPTDLAAVVAEVESLDPNTGRREWSAQEQTRTNPAEWEDVDEEPKQQRKKSRRTSVKASAEKAQRGPRTSSAGRFFSNLSLILESGESVVGSRSQQKATGSETGRKQRHRDNKKSNRHGEDNSISHRRAARHRSLGFQRRQESLLRSNPSLLSVLSAMTGSSGNSGGSGSTITQKSFDRRGSDASKRPASRPRRADSAMDESTQEPGKPSHPNVFDFMDTNSANDANDGHSVILSSPSTSRYEPSEGSSSEAPTAPSSFSTFPSPSSTRRTSVAELRQRYDPQYSSSPRSPSVRAGSRSPEYYSRARKQPSVSDVPEVDEYKVDSPVMEPERPQEDSHRSSSRSSRSRSTSQRLRDQEESLRRHVAHTQQPYQAYHVDPVYSQHRSYSEASTASDQAAYNMALQQYQHAPMPIHPPPIIQPLDEDRAFNHPPAPEPPDVTQKHIEGYELLATQLANPTSPIKPLYRKFTHLNHRILLHLQDELSELEEQLRTLDELALQYDGSGHLASRRAETYQGSELHHRRRNLLGLIFTKSDQYNRAMNSFTNLSQHPSPPRPEDIETYRIWLRTHNPVHESETRFLNHPDDLISPSSKTPATSPAAPSSSIPPSTVVENPLPYLPVPLLLPLLLFPLIPTLAGRTLVTLLIALGASVFAATTRVGGLMSAREWTVGGVVYILLMAAVGVVVPRGA